MRDDDRSSLGNGEPARSSQNSYNILLLAGGVETLDTRFPNSLGVSLEYPTKFRRELKSLILSNRKSPRKEVASHYADTIQYSI